VVAQVVLLLVERSIGFAGHQGTGTTSTGAAAAATAAGTAADCRYGGYGTAVAR